VNSKFEDIVEFSGIEEFIDTPVQNYSSGMVVRLGFAVAAHVNPDILLVDEILAVGDWGFQRKCFNKIGELRKNGTAIALVSHNMQVVSTFSEKAILLDKGQHRYFDNIAIAVKEYAKLFSGEKHSDIEKICSGNGNIDFYDIHIEKQKFYPGESFSISMHYNSLIEYPDIQIDTKIMCSNEPEIYFQATNEAYNEKIDLKKGKHQLEIEVENIPINNSNALISISIWANKRTEALFWWRIPLEFEGADFSVGKNALNMIYKLK
jgi:lipopolysaccharide transport system ATP-binding protein